MSVKTICEPDLLLACEVGAILLNQLMFGGRRGAGYVLLLVAG